MARASARRCIALIHIAAHAQPAQLGPSGDFCIDDRPGTAPTVGAPGGPSVAPDPTLFRDLAGTKTPDEILKSLDKDLGKNPGSDPGGPSTGPSSLELERELRQTPERFLK